MTRTTEITPEDDRWGRRLPAAAEEFLRSINPWWQDQPMRRLPAFERWLFEPVRHRLLRGLAPITVLRGPRQVGKTILQQQVIRHLLEHEGVEPARIFHVQFDDLPDLEADGLPIHKLVFWYQHQVLGQTLNAAARDDRLAFLILDEVQNLDSWAPELKSLVDHHDVRILVTGSSALRIEAGRDSLAGRISTLEMGTLVLREIATLRGFGELPPAMELNGLGALQERAFWEALGDRGRRDREIRDQAFAAFAERGGYPAAQIRADEPWDDLADYLEETVIRRVLRHDLRRPDDEDSDKAIDPRVLEEVLRAACRYAGQAPGPAVFIREIRSALAVDVDWQQVLAALGALTDSLLLRRIPPLELRLRRRQQGDKWCLCDHSLRAAWLREIVPLTASDLAVAAGDGSRLAGPIAESILGALLASVPGLDVTWSPRRHDAPEIDFIVTVGTQRIPIEVKYRRRIDAVRDAAGLRSFVDQESHHAPFGLLVTLGDGVEVADPRVVSLPLASLLLLR
jgi:predicted AAA+ superfamily ATPase